MRAGQEVPLIRCPEWLPGDLAHDTASWHAMYNDGAMDGFALGEFGPYFAYSQFERRDVPNYYRWADRYVLCDNFFASVAGPSHPNHLFLIAGQAGGAIDNPENIRVKQLNDGRQFKSWGCDAYGDGVFINVQDERGNITPHSTCFDMKTVGHQLSNRNIDWAYYSADPYQAGYIWQAYASIESIFEDEEMWDEHIWPVDDLMRDIEADALPPVTWITPTVPAVGPSPVQHEARPQLGHRHRERDHAIRACGSEPRSSSHGTNGVACTTTSPPPRIDDVDLGFRVPMMVISPYAKEGYIDDAFAEFTAPLRFISDNWDLPPLTRRDPEVAQLRARVRLRAQAPGWGTAPAREGDERLLGLARGIPGLAGLARAGCARHPLSLRRGTAPRPGMHASVSSSSEG